MYAIKMNNGRYVYFTYIAGNQNLGYLIEIYDFFSDEIEYDTTYISSHPPLILDDKYIIMYPQENDLDKFVEIKQVNLDYKKISYTFFCREPIKCGKGLFELLGFSYDMEITDKEYESTLCKAALDGQYVHCTQYEIDEHQVNISGKFEYVKSIVVDSLPNKLEDIMICGEAYLIEDIEHYIKYGMDRITAKRLIYC